MLCKDTMRKVPATETPDRNPSQCFSVFYVTPDASDGPRVRTIAAFDDTGSCRPGAVPVDDSVSYVPPRPRYPGARFIRGRFEPTPPAPDGD